MIYSNNRIPTHTFVTVLFEYVSPATPTNCCVGIFLPSSTRISSLHSLSATRHLYKHHILIDPPNVRSPALVIYVSLTFHGGVFNMFEVNGRLRMASEHDESSQIFTVVSEHSRWLCSSSMGRWYSRYKCRRTKTSSILCLHSHTPVFGIRVPTFNGRRWQFGWRPHATLFAACTPTTRVDILCRKSTTQRTQHLLWRQRSWKARLYVCLSSKTRAPISGTQFHRNRFAPRTLCWQRWVKLEDAGKLGRWQIGGQSLCAKMSLAIDWWRANGSWASVDL